MSHTTLPGPDHLHTSNRATRNVLDDLYKEAVARGCEICGGRPVVFFPCDTKTNEWVGHLVCSPCDEAFDAVGWARAKNRFGGVTIGCVDDIPDPKLALIALRRGGPESTSHRYEFVGGPVDGKVLRVDRHTTRMLIPAGPGVSLNMFDETAAPTKTEKVAIYDKKMCPNGVQVFECENDAELRNAGLLT